MTNAFIRTGDSLSLYTDEGDHIVHRNSNPNFDDILDALKRGDFDTAVDLIDMVTAVDTFGEGKVKVVDGVITYNGEELHDYTASKVLDMMDEGFDVQPMLLFLENLMANPSKRAVDELYTFLEYGKLPITEDGCFLAWKKIRSNFKDIHSGTFDNSVGSKPSMPRNKVNEDPNVTCSHGLHVCSKEYLSSFGGYGGNIVVTVKVNPKDVVAVPKDYNNTKMRVCEYEVIAVAEENNYDHKASVVDTKTYANYYNKRDALGRFSY